MATPVLDLSRSFSRLGRGAATGIDRVERAYLEENIRRNGWGLIRTPRGFLLFEPDRLARLPEYFDRTDLDGADQASTIRAIASSRSSNLSIRKIMWRMPNGLAYINVGQTNLNPQTMRAMMEMPDHSKIVMIHDTIPIDHPTFQTEASRAKFVERLTTVINFANHIIVPSDEVRENVERRMVGTGHRVPITVSPLGVDIGSTPIDYEKSEKPYFVVLGTIEPRKRGSLFVAFDTTALALTLSIVLMFLQFFTDRFESQLLDVVDRRTHEELSPLYQNSSPVDPQANAIHEVGKLVLAGAHQVMNQQLKLWENSLQSSEQTFSRSLAGFQKTVQEDLCEAVKSAVAELASVMNRSTDSFDEKLQQRFDNWQKILAANTDGIGDRWNQCQAMLSDSARQLSQSSELVSEQLHMAQEVLDEINTIQHQLGSNPSSLEPLDSDQHAGDPTLRVVSNEPSRNRLNHIYRFVTKPVEHSDAA